MLDPLNRWQQYGEKPDFAGLATFLGLPYTEDPAALQGVDVAIIGAPSDDLVSDRPGARLGPRGVRNASCPAGPRIGSEIDATRVLRCVDFGDAAVVPGRPAASHAAIEALVAELARHGVLPLTVGGDHSITLPVITALAAKHGPVGVIHLDAHTDTGETVFGAVESHGTIFRQMVDQGTIDPARYWQIGLRGYWPGPEVFAWQRDRGIRWHSADDVAAAGMSAVLDEVLAGLGAGPVYLSVDIDVIEPGLIGSATGTPEAGGLSTREVLQAVARIGEATSLVGADVVEVAPRAIGTADAASLVADRILREILHGVAARRLGHAGA
jgi:agmatinase